MDDEKRFKIRRRELELERLREKRLYREKSLFKSYFLYTVFALVIIGIFFGTYMYFFVFNPVFVEKPYIEKPVIEEPEEFEVNDEHLEYLTNEVGGYKLHSTPVSKEKPVIEFFITNFQDTYTLTVEDHNVTAVEGSAVNPDIRITGSKEVFRQLLVSEDIAAELNRLVRWKKIEFEILTDESTLAMKGYKALYDALSGEYDAEGTGKATGFFEVGMHAGVSGFNFIGTMNNVFMIGFMCLFIVALLLGFDIHQKHK
jgi:hypothetical protein